MEQKILANKALTVATLLGAFLIGAPSDAESVSVENIEQLKTEYAKSTTSEITIENDIETDFDTLGPLGNRELYIHSENGENYVIRSEAGKNYVIGEPTNSLPSTGFIEGASGGIINLSDLTFENLIAKHSSSSTHNGGGSAFVL